MAAREKEDLDRLETLARGTEDLRPADEFTAALMAKIQDSSAASILENARRQTAELTPNDDFVAAVMHTVGQGSGLRLRPESDWNARIVRHSRFALMGAAVAAAFCLWLSSQAQSRFDATILEDVAELEVDE
ncbi:MAG TPA: hypothetical protein PK156_02410 [Polyangium sp.]|nr:hypothetical protein [Polyangium sp.]